MSFNLLMLGLFINAYCTVAYYSR